MKISMILATFTLLMTSFSFAETPVLAQGNCANHQVTVYDRQQNAFCVDQLICPSHTRLQQSNDYGRPALHCRIVGDSSLLFPPDVVKALKRNCHDVRSEVPGGTQEACKTGVNWVIQNSSIWHFNDYQKACYARFGEHFNGESCALGAQFVLDYLYSHDLTSTNEDNEGVDSVSP